MPPVASRFVGREAERAFLADRVRIEDRAVRLTIVVGPPGVGKTRLVTEVVNEVAPSFDAPPTVVFLAALRDADQVMGAVARAIGVRDDNGPALDRIAERVGSDRRLLVLDNFEHVMAAAPEVGALLTACPNLRIVVTSRHRLFVHGESPLELRPLPLPDAADLRDPSQFWRVPSVALFAAQAGPSLRQTEEETATVAAICVRLDGLPLALELAAGRIVDHSPEEILAKLERGIDILDDPSRRLTLHDSLMASYALLPEELQRFFVCLSVFVGGFELDAAVAMASGWSAARGYPLAGGISFPHFPWTTVLGRESPADIGPWDPPELPPLALDAHRALDELIRRHLIRLVPGGRTQRYDMLETIRAFGLECLATSGADNRTATLHAHAAIMVAAAEAAGVGLTQGQRPIWLARILDDMGNVRAAYDWLTDQGEHTPGANQLALRIADGLGTLWQTTGRASQGRAWLNAALARPGTSGSLRASALYCTGILAWIQQDLDAAERALADGERLSLQVGYRICRGRCIFGQGLIAWSRGDFAAMEASLVATLDQCPPNEDIVVHGLALVALAIGARAKALGVFGEPEPTGLIEASRLIATAYALFQPLGFGWGMATARLYDASIFRLQGKRGLAVPALREALQIYVADEDPWGTGAAICNLAIYVAEDGDLDGAARLFGAVDAFQEQGATILPPTELESQTAAIQAIRHKVGADVFDAKFAVGRRMSPTAAIAAAMATPTSSAQGRTPLPDLAPPIELTERQLDILERLANGQVIKEIAENLGIGDSAVYNHVNALRTKLDARTGTHLVAIALRRGLI